MRRGWKILIALLVLLVALLVVNASVTGSEKRGAEITVAGEPAAEILELDSVDLQVVDMPATGPGPEGAPIVLLHCYACSLRWWDKFAPLLNESHRVIRLDLIGFGGSQKPGSGYSMDIQARAVAEALNQLGVEGAVVVGHSMGGVVAAALAQNSSELVDRVAVIGTASSLGDDAELPFIARLTYTPLLGEALWRVRPSSAVRSGYESAFAPGFDFEAAFENPDQVIEDNEAMTYTSYAESSDGARSFTDAEPLASRFTSAAVPLLAILGSEDQIVDSEATAEAYGTVPGADVRVLDGVGHSAQLEDPETTARLLNAFAAEAPRPQPEPRPGSQPSGQQAPGKKKQRANARRQRGNKQQGGKQRAKNKPKANKQGQRKGKKKQRG